MEKSKFFYFTIKGDDLHPMDIKEKVDLPCEIFIKDETTIVGILKRPVIQKTNRWVYRSSDQGEMGISPFLVSQLEILAKHVVPLKEYTTRYHSLIELVIYEEREISNFNIKLSKRAQYLLNKIGVKFSITFIDWS